MRTTNPTPRFQRSTVWFLALLAAGLTAPACADDSEEYFDYTELACEPGSHVPCACPGAGRGTATCLGDGSGYSACERCTGPDSCTTFPNCDGCTECLDICNCQTYNSNPAACEARCAGEGSEAGGAGGGGGMAGGLPPPPGGQGGGAGMGGGSGRGGRRGN
jgi:hypothetical protein